MRVLAVVVTGIVVRRGADEMFEQRVQALTATLRDEMELYEAEQRTLQVVTACASAVLCEVCTVFSREHSFGRKKSLRIPCGNLLNCAAHCNRPLLVL